MVVVACNTAAAAALHSLQESFDVPVVGVIEPGVRALVQTSETGRVGVIGTVGSVNSGAYQAAVALESPSSDLTAVACPGFVEFVERGEFDSEQVHVLAEALLAPARDAKVDALLLGCTHYPFLRAAIAHAAPGITLIDPAPAVAQQAIRLSLAHGATIHEHGQTAYYTTGSTTHLQWQIDALGLPPGTVRARTKEEQT